MENIGFFDNNPNVKPAVHRHMSFNTGWMTDSKSHWKVCDIDKEKYEFAEHTFVEHKTDKTKLISYNSRISDLNFNEFKFFIFF